MMNEDMKLTALLFLLWVGTCGAMIGLAYVLTEPIGVVIDIQPDNDGGLEGELQREGLVKTIEERTKQE